MTLRAASVCLLAMLAVSGCTAPEAPKTPPSTMAAAAPAAPAPAPAEDEAPVEPAPEATPLPAGIAPLMEPFKADLDGMVKRRLIRVLTVQNPINYFVDRGRELGITYESAVAFEKRLNQSLGNKVVTVHVVMIPVARDELIPRLLKGEGDIAAAMLTVTP